MPDQSITLCPVCGQPAAPYRGFGQRPVYCSKPCKQRANYLVHREERRQQARSRRETDREAINARQRARRLERGEEFRARDRVYRKQHQERLSAQERARYPLKRERIIEQVHRWYQENREQVIAKKIIYKRANRDRINARNRATYGAVPRKRLRDSISRLMNKSLTTGKGGKSWQELVGYTLEELMAHLESRFLPGMTWDNHGKAGWHVDHIRPMASFSFESPADPDFKDCWALENLQPLWGSDNLRKGAKLDWPMEYPK